VGFGGLSYRSDIFLPLLRLKRAALVVVLLLENVRLCFEVSGVLDTREVSGASVCLGLR
jgi:hypothetical protein